MRVTLLALVATCVAAYPVSESSLAADHLVAPAQRAIAGPMLDEASWYGTWHHGKPTANGESFDMYELTAAHKGLPFGTLVRVTDVSSGRDVVVRINDRGPYWENRTLDLSYAAAEELGILDSGLAQVRIEVVGRLQQSAQQKPEGVLPDQIG